MRYSRPYRLRGLQGAMPRARSRWRSEAAPSRRWPRMLRGTNAYSVSPRRAVAGSSPLPTCSVTRRSCWEIFGMSEQLSVALTEAEILAVLVTCSC